MSRHADRLERLRRRLQRPALISRLPNLRYLTGFSGSNGYLLVDESRAVFVTDGRYGEVAGRLVEQLPGTDLEVYQGPLWPMLGRVLGGLPEVSLESEGVTWGFARRLAEEIDGELVPAEGVVEELRRRKDEDEVVALRRAAEAGDQAFSALDRLTSEASTEGELGWALQQAMRSHGGETADWEPIVAFGPNASLPHHRAGRTPIGDGLLLLDYGCVVDGYHSDMSRTVWRGPADGEWSGIHAAVLEAQRAAIDAVAPGVPAREVDSAARKVLEGHSLADHFVHSTGHGVGLEIHEDPRVAATSDHVLEEGDVITVEPGVYLPGRGGVRIEDMVAVTREGPVLLTASPRELS